MPMQERRYPWERFWYERGKEPSLWDDGFLLGPEDENAAWSNPDAQSLQDLADRRCLVLLGEPGMGKSVEICKEHLRLSAVLQASRDLALHFDLKDFTESQITPELFGCAEVQAWRAGDHRLFLFLDSLDEGILSIGNLAHVLARKLNELTDSQRERLHLRVGCRDRDWPPPFEEALRRLWPAQQGDDRPVRVCHLAPLRKKDVRLAGEAVAVDAGAFLDEVIQKDLSAFANRPLTLDFLLGYPLQDEPIPDSRERIFNDGCMHLCRERSDLHRRSGRLEPSERLRVAGRVAAAMFFSGRTAVWRAREGQASQKDDLLTSDVVDAPESMPLDSMPVTKPDIEETLGTALFASRGTDRVSWSHQSYGEFLAAWYLRSRGMNVGQVMGLISHPEAPDHKLVPQLQEVAAWLATMVDGVFDRILEVEPEVLLGSDVAPADCGRRRRLATRVLQLIEDGDLNDGYWGFAAYRKLRYPGIADEIRPHLLSRGHSRMRHTAIWVAAACSLAELQDDLVAVALDPSDDYNTRWRAVWALNHIADAETRPRLSPLALAKPDQYPDDQLQSYALQALWPKHMSTAGVLEALKQNAPGQFLHYMARKLSTDDFPLVLSWLAEHDHLRRRGDLAEFTDEVLVRALDLLGVSTIREPVARIVVSSLRTDSRVLDSLLVTEAEKALHSDPGRRRNLLSALFPLLDDPGSDVWRLCSGTPQLAVPEDVPWLIQQFGSTRDATTRNMIAGLIDHLVLSYANPLGYQAVLEACESDPELAVVFGSRVVRQVPLDSPQVRRAQYREYRQQVWRKRAEARRPPRIDPAREIPRLLCLAETVGLDAYVELTHILAREPNGGPAKDFFCPDLTVSPGWLAGDPPTRERILRASEVFARQFQPTVLDLLARGIAYDEIAGYKALRLLLAHGSSALAQLSAAQWARWAPIVLRYPASGEVDEPKAHQLATMAYAGAAEAALHALSRILRGEGSAEHTDLVAVERLSDCWDDALTNTVLAEASRPDFGAEALQRLIETLLTLGAEQAGTFAESLLSLPEGADDVVRARAAAAAAALMNHGGPGKWQAIQPALFADRALGVQAISRAVPHVHAHAPPFIQHLGPAELAELYIWLHEQLPDERNPFDPIPKAKRAVLEALVRAGTWAACDQMRRIAERFPGELWRKWQVQNAEETARRASWPRPSPAHVLDLTRSTDKHLVRSGRELLDAIIHSLARFEDTLQAKAAVNRLWNDRPRTPKDEKALAREVAWHLRGDLQSRGLVTGCEVEVRPGQRTDVHVEAVTRVAGSSGYATITAIIETKGSWHPDVATGMRWQLVDRYMAQNNCNFGIYLVGHFTCDRWEPGEDRSEQQRKKRSQRHSLDGLRAMLEGQAQELSTAGRDVRALVLDCSRRS